MIVGVPRFHVPPAFSPSPLKMLLDLTLEGRKKSSIWTREDAKLVVSGERVNELSVTFLGQSSILCQDYLKTGSAFRTLLNIAKVQECLSGAK